MRRLGTFLSRPGLGASLVRASLGSTGLRIAGLGFSFLLTLQLARGLGPASYGIYGTAMAVLAILAATAELGMARLVTREISSAEVTRDWARIRGVLAWSRRMALKISLVLMAATAAGAWLVWDDERMLALTILIGLAWVPLVAVGNIEAAGLVGFRHLIKGQVPEVLLRPAFFSLFLFTAAGLSLPLSPWSAMGFGVASTAVATIVCAVLLRRFLPSEVRREQPRLHPQIWLKGSLPIALSEAVRVGQAHIVILILAAIAPDTVTGNYRAAVSIFALFVLPETMFNLLTAPIMSRLRTEGDHARLQRMLAFTAAAGTAATLLLVGPFLIFREGLVVLLLGEEYRAAAAPLAVLGVGVVLTAATGPGLVLLNIAHQDREVVKAGAIAVAALIIVTAPAILLMGAAGAAASFIFSSFLWRLLVRQRALRLLELDPSLISFRRAQQSS